MSSLRKFFSSLRARLLALVLLTTLPALIVTLSTGFKQREQAALAAQNDALRFVRFTAVSQQNLIENTRGFLTALSHSFAYRDNSITNCSDIFSHVADSHFQFYSAFYVADMHGNLMCTMEHGDVPANLIECEHYQKLLKAEGFVLSQYHICRNTGKAVISIGHPVMDENNQPIGIINISIDLAWLRQLVQNAQIPTGAVLMIFDAEGTVLSRHPDSETWIGESIPDDLLSAAASVEGEGTIEGAGIDGTHRLYAFTQQTGTEPTIYITYGLPTEIAYAEAEQMLRQNLILLGTITLLALIAAWFFGDVFVLRQTQKLVSRTQQIAAGDFNARTGDIANQGEFGNLAHAIDQMAASLAAREDSLRTYAGELERSNRDLQDFANIASHDLQEPLRKIQVFCDLLETRYAAQLDPQGRTHIQRLTNAANRMQCLIKDLLDYSRISTRANTLNQVNLDQVARQVIHDLDLTIEEVQGRIYLEDLPVIEADEIQMYQLFFNLLSNALKFHQETHPPIIRVASQTRFPYSGNGGAVTPELEIRIQDNGIGFNPKYIDRIFLPFQRLHTRANYAGTGMGLAICRKIVERHGGAISAESYPGEGTTFVITLPVQQDNGDSPNGYSLNAHSARRR